MASCFTCFRPWRDDERLKASLKELEDIQAGAAGGNANARVENWTPDIAAEVIAKVAKPDCEVEVHSNPETSSSVDGDRTPRQVQDGQEETGDAQSSSEKTTIAGALEQDPENRHSADACAEKVDDRAGKPAPDALDAKRPGEAGAATAVGSQTVAKGSCSPVAACRCKAAGGDAARRGRGDGVAAAAPAGCSAGGDSAATVATAAAPTSTTTAPSAVGSSGGGGGALCSSCGGALSGGGASGPGSGTTSACTGASAQDSSSCQTSSGGGAVAATPSSSDKRPWRPPSGGGSSRRLLPRTPEDLARTSSGCGQTPPPEAVTSGPTKTPSSNRYGWGGGAYIAGGPSGGAGKPAMAPSPRQSGGSPRSSGNGKAAAAATASVSNGTAADRRQTGSPNAGSYGGAPLRVRSARLYTAASMGLIAGRSTPPPPLGVFTSASTRLALHDALHHRSRGLGGGGAISRGGLSVNSLANIDFRPAWRY